MRLWIGRSEWASSGLPGCAYYSAAVLMDVLNMRLNPVYVPITSWKHKIVLHQLKPEIDWGLCERRRYRLRSHGAVRVCLRNVSSVRWHALTLIKAKTWDVKGACVNWPFVTVLFACEQLQQESKLLCLLPFKIALGEYRVQLACARCITWTSTMTRS